jgi:hypothetical protein
MKFTADMFLQILAMAFKRFYDSILSNCCKTERNMNPVRKTEGGSNLMFALRVGVSC